MIVGRVSLEAAPPSARHDHAETVLILRRRLRPAAAFAGLGHLPKNERLVELSPSGPRLVGIHVAGPILPKGSRRLPACQTILNEIGNLLADDCQVEEFLFAGDIFGFFGKLPIRRRLVPKIIIPIHACHGA